MAGVSTFGFLVSLPFLKATEMSNYEIAVRALDLVTTTVPPALPACIGIGISYALSRLKDLGIMCINRDRVNMAGKVDLVVFDKTGTLTEDHLDIYGFRGIRYKKGKFCFDRFTDDMTNIVKESYKYYKEKSDFETVEKEDRNKNLRLLYTECLATCHSITKVNGKLIGDPIDIKMFDSTEWILNEDLEDKENYESLISTYLRPGQEQSLNEKLENLGEDDDEDICIQKHYEIGIVRRFDFSSKLQRMSVLVKNSNEPYFKVFAKGSPEKIKELCVEDSIPEDFSRILSKYTTKGFRVLALAVKRLKMSYPQSQKLSRETAEEKMIFLGLLIVQNKLKEQTISSVEDLSEAGLKMLMATGDNIFTAISVAKECSLIIPEAKIYMCEITKEKNEDGTESNKLSWNQVDNYVDDDSIIFESPVISPNRRFLDATAGNFSLVMGAHNLSDDGSFERKGSFELKEKENKHNIQVLEGINLEIVDNIPHNWNEEDDILAVTGHTFETLLKFQNKYLENPENIDFKAHHDTFRLVLKHGYIFARMSPENKTQLVAALKQEGFTVCMCGDGANDCGALKAANVGMSLSIEEASIAAHFTSNIPDISCLINLFREGKASLITSIQCFKYMMLYSLIQFTSVTLLMIYASYLTDNQFLVIDLVIIFPVAILMSRTEANPILTHHQPTGALISTPIIISILSQTSVQFICQFGILLLLCSQKWYVSIKELGIEAADHDTPPSAENTAVYLISFAQYLTTAIIFSMGGPFKKPFYTNYLLCSFLALGVAFTYYIIISNESYFCWLFSLVKFDNGKFKYVVLICVLVNYLASFIVSIVIVPVLTKIFSSNKGEDEPFNRSLKKKTSVTLENLHKIKLNV